MASCNVGLCTEPRANGSAQCEKHRRDTERERGTSAERGYNSAVWRKRTRPTVLRRDPFCTCTAEDCHPEHPGDGRCMRVSTDVDHHPESRRELVARGADPNDPKFSRGMCHSCHSRKTARERR